MEPEWETWKYVEMEPAPSDLTRLRVALLWQDQARASVHAHVTVRKLWKIRKQKTEEQQEQRRTAGKATRGGGEVTPGKG